MQRLTYAFTGHRPDKLGGYGADVADMLTSLALSFIGHRRDLMIISGMALGWDQAVARAACQLGLPWIAAVPFVGQEKSWPAESQRRYHWLLTHAREVKVVCPGGYVPAKMHKRNEWMVDNSDLLVALWDGTPGGTGSCVAYAKRAQKPVTNLWPKWSAMTPR